MSDPIQIQATLVISPLEVVRLLQATNAAVKDGPGGGLVEKVSSAEQQEPTRVRRRKAKAKTDAEPPAPAAPERFRLKLDTSAPFEAQVKSAVLQIITYKHGDAITRKVFKDWAEEDDNAVRMFKTFYPTATIETIAKATADADESEFKKHARLFIGPIFKSASAMVAEKVVVPKACDVCEVAGGHAPGCPIAIQESPASDGGAIPSRVRNAEAAPVETPPQTCPNGGPVGCPFPSHAVILQGGVRIFVHPNEAVRALQEAMGVPQPTDRFTLPPPPEAAAPAKPRRGGKSKRK